MFMSPPSESILGFVTAFLAVRAACTGPGGGDNRRLFSMSGAGDIGGPGEETMQHRSDHHTGGGKILTITGAISHCCSFDLRGTDLESLETRDFGGNLGVALLGRNSGEGDGEGQFHKHFVEKSNDRRIGHHTPFAFFHEIRTKFPRHYAEVDCGCCGLRRRRWSE